jgi:hypothetical protein
MTTDDDDWKTNGKCKLGGWRPGAGRKPNIPNNLTRELREAIIYGAREGNLGRDPEHPELPGTLERFFVNLCNDHLSLFCGLLSKGIPKLIESQSTATLDISYRTTEQVKEAMVASGMAPKFIEQLEAILPKGDVIEDEETKQ